VAPRLLVGVQHVDDVAAVVLVADVEEPLDVLDLAERFDDVRGGVLLDVSDPGVEVVEDVVFDGVDAVVFENLHRVAPILFEVIGVRRPAHDGFPLLAEFLGERTRPDVGADPDVVENDDVGPLDLRAPVVRLRDEPSPISRSLSASM